MHKTSIRNLKKLINKYKKILGIEDFKIDVMVCEDGHVVSDKQSNAKLIKDDTYAEVINKDYKTKEFSIAINKFALKKDLEDTIIHELLHILLWSYTDMFDVVLTMAMFPPEKQAEINMEMAQREHFVIERFIKAIMG